MDVGASTPTPGAPYERAPNTRIARIRSQWILDRTDGGLLMLLFNQHEEPDTDFEREFLRFSSLVAEP
jgi:hypothetical protein